MFIYSASIIPHEWIMSGRELSEMTQDDFKTKVPSDPGDLFWTHLVRNKTLEKFPKCSFPFIYYTST